MFNSVNKLEMTDLRKKLDSAHCCQADMELADDEIPVTNYLHSWL